MTELDFDYDPANEELSNMLLDSEEVITTISGVGGSEKTQPCFVLTDKRLLRYKNNFLGDESDSYRLDNISGVDRSTGMWEKIEIRGSGVDEEFKLDAKEDVDAFVKKLRERTL